MLEVGAGTGRVTRVVAPEAERVVAVDLLARHLRPGGLLVIDAHWLSPEVRPRAARPDGWRHARTIGDPEEELEVVQVGRIDPETSRARAEYEYRRGGRVVGRASFRPRLWSPEEVRTRFPAAGFRLRRMLGSFREDPWEPATASNLILEAVREPSAPGG